MHCKESCLLSLKKNPSLLSKREPAPCLQDHFVDFHVYIVLSFPNVSLNIPSRLPSLLCQKRHYTRKLFACCPKIALFHVLGSNPHRCKSSIQLANDSQFTNPGDQKSPRERFLLIRIKLRMKTRRYCCLRLLLNCRFCWTLKNILLLSLLSVRHHSFTLSRWLTREWALVCG